MFKCYICARSNKAAEWSTKEHCWGNRAKGRYPGIEPSLVRRGGNLFLTRALVVLKGEVGMGREYDVTASRI